MARLLVNKGANPNLKNKLGKTALEIATDCEKREVRSYLDRRTSVKPERSMPFLIILVMVFNFCIHNLQF